MIQVDIKSAVIVLYCFMDVVQHSELACWLGECAMQIYLIVKYYLLKYKMCLVMFCVYRFIHI